MAKRSQDTKPARRPQRAKRKHEDSGDERSGYRQKIREKKLAEGSKSKGCARQMMLLFIPIVAVSAYWFLKP